MSQVSSYRKPLILYELQKKFFTLPVIGTGCNLQIVGLPLRVHKSLILRGVYQEKRFVLVYATAAAESISVALGVLKLTSEKKLCKVKR